jgi:hypothetical protein
MTNVTLSSPATSSSGSGAQRATTATPAITVRMASHCAPVGMMPAASPIRRLNAG